MSAASDHKRSNRKAKKKRSAQQMKENQVPKAAATSGKNESIQKTGLDATIPLSQVVNKSSFTPFLDGERCILCHQERPSIARSQDAEKSSSGVDILPGAQQFVDKLPLWVCPECRKKVEEDERKAGLDSTLHTVNNDMLFQTSEGLIDSFVPEEGPEKDLCGCHVCAGERHLVPAKTKEMGELQFSWFEVKHFVRCIYRKAGTTLADDDKLTKTSLDMDRMKRHTEKLTSQDPCQLFERLEAQTREYLTEVRVSLIKFFSSTFSNSLQHAKDCVMTLLDEYQSLCVATDMLKPFFQKLDTNYLKNFKWSWELMNKELFDREIFNHSVIRDNLPQLFQQFSAGISGSSCAVPVSDKCVKDSHGELIKRFETFTWEMTATNALWTEVQPLREKYNREKNLHERGDHEKFLWDEPLKNVTLEKSDKVCGCDECDFASRQLTSTNDVFDSLLSLKRSLSSSSSSSSSRSPTQYCSRHAQDGSTDGDELMSSTQLLPTALFLNRLTNSKCAPCIREALHSFCFDQNTSTKCRHHEDPDFTPSLTEPPNPPEACQDTSHEHPYPFWYNHDTPPPETASSIQSLVLNENSTGGRCQSTYCKNHCTEWEDEGFQRYEECRSLHEGPFSPSIVIPGNNEDVEAPPSSPSSDRSAGDGSSWDTPTSGSSVSEDGRSNNGKYCDCCYCEFFGHGTAPVAQTSHNFVEMREKLRLRLKEKERKAIDYTDHSKGLGCITDHRTDTRSVDELLTFINGDQGTRNLENKASSKAAKRQRQKQKKAAGKETHEVNGTCLLRQNQVYEIDERPPISEEKPKKNTCQRKSSKAKSRENLTETQKENAKNHEKTLRNGEKIHAKENGGVVLDEKPALVKQGTENHIDKRKKSKEKKNAVSKIKCQEGRVIVNGSSQESACCVEHTRGARIPVQEEATPNNCGAETQVTHIENQGKKTKSRKKKKGGCLDDVFLPKENLTNGRNGEVDEAEREVEEFKRFCASVAPVTRKLKLPANVNLKNLNLGSKKC